MSKIRNMKLRYKIGVGVAAGAAVVGAGSAAFAYWTTTGAGTGSANVQSSNGTVALTATFSGTNLYPGSAAIPVAITGANSGATNLFVTSIDPGTITVDSGHSACNLSDFSLSGATLVNSSGVEVAHGTSGVSVATDSLTFANSDVSQDACKGATITLHYTSN